MTTAMLPENLKLVLEKVSKILKSNNIKHNIIGGISVGYYANPRTTQDVDILISQSDLNKVIDILGQGRFIGNENRMDILLQLMV